MRPQCSHITRKRGVYYYRRRLPRPHSGEVALSLGTRNYREAEHLTILLDEVFPPAFRKAMYSPKLLSVLRQYLRTALQADLEQRLSTPPGKAVYTRPYEDEDPVDADLDVIDGLLAEAREALARRNYRSVAATVAKLMEEHSLPDDQRTLLSLGVLQANVQMLEKERERVLGVAEPIVLDEPPAAPAPAIAAPTQAIVPKPAPSTPKLSELLPGFLDFMVKEEGWRGQTLMQNTATYRMFLECCGDRPVAEYRKRDLATFYDLLRGLPALYAKDRRWRGLSLAEIVERSAGEQVERLAMKTIKRHFSALGRLFDYGKKRGLVDGDNPAHGFEFPTRGRARDARRMWEGGRLARLFSSPVWTGCFSEDRRSRSGDLIIKDDRYWLPILGLYHGNRLEEFAQLRREDIREEDGIWFFDIHDAGGRKLKNQQSKRWVPIHPVLLRLGFLDYVNEMAKLPGDPVFPLLRPGGPDKKLGYYFTKWWTEYRKAVGVYERGLDYHSFRHGVTTKLYAAGVPDAVVDELTGHEGQGTSRTVYKKALPLPALYEALAKVRWPEVEGLLAGRLAPAPINGMPVRQPSADLAGRRSGAETDDLPTEAVVAQRLQAEDVIAQSGMGAAQ